MMSSRTERKVGCTRGRRASSSKVVSPPASSCVQGKANSSTKRSGASDKQQPSDRAAAGADRGVSHKHQQFNLTTRQADLVRRRHPPDLLAVRAGDDVPQLPPGPPQHARPELLQDGEEAPGAVVEPAVEPVPHRELQDQDADVGAIGVVVGPLEKSDRWRDDQSLRVVVEVVHEYHDVEEVGPSVPYDEQAQGRFNMHVYDGQH